MTATPTGVEMTADGTGLSVRLVHGPSRREVTTTPPADNGGTGDSFSPTDLLGASLLSCALTTMALYAKRDGDPWGTTHGKVEKRMTGAGSGETVQNPRRVGELVCEVRMPAGLPPPLRAKYEDIGRNCPVAKSLGAAVRVTMDFVYPD